MVLGRAELGRPWGSSVVFFPAQCLLDFILFINICTASDVSEAVLNHARFRPWGVARIKTISCSVAETLIAEGSRQLQVVAVVVVAVWVSAKVLCTALRVRLSMPIDCSFLPYLQ